MSGLWSLYGKQWNWKKDIYPQLHRQFTKHNAQVQSLNHVFLSTEQTR